jgi:hypothetical protein
VQVTKQPRDPRVDIFRGLALWMIFVDHMPSDQLNLITMHNFGFADAAEVFVLLAGFSSMAAYGRAFSEHGSAEGIRRIALRCLKIYAAQVILLLLTLLVVQLWTSHYDLEPRGMTPILQGGVKPLRQAVTLRALPEYLDILPLYIVLLAMFPLLFVAIRRSVALALGASAALWGLVLLYPRINLPNLFDPDGNGWYFDPFSWQFLFAIGMALSLLLRHVNGMLPRRWPITAAAVLYLLFALRQGGAWKDWGLPSLQLFDLPAPDKSHESVIRILDILALSYLVLGSPALFRLARQRWLRPLEACGKNSLVIFSLCTIFAVFGRLSFRTFGAEWPMQLAVNGLGVGLMIAAALWLEQRRDSTKRRVSVTRPVAMAPK